MVPQKESIKLFILFFLYFKIFEDLFFFGLSSEFPYWVSELFWDIYSFYFAFYGSFIAGAFSILAETV
jgi:hypothetical protein